MLKAPFHLLLLCTPKYGAE